MSTSPVLADVYSLDLNGKPNTCSLAFAGAPWNGLGIKVTEGTYYQSGDWGKQFWPLARYAAGSRYGVDWFRYGYHYYRVGEDPIAQADFFLKTIDSWGGWGPGDLWPVVDVESG